jgi:hypothetical protein
MSRFKVGDRVKIVFNHPTRGAIGTIISIDHAGIKFVRYDDPRYHTENGKWAADSSLELVMRESSDNYDFEERVAYWTKVLN